MNTYDIHVDQSIPANIVDCLLIRSFCGEYPQRSLNASCFDILGSLPFALGCLVVRLSMHQREKTATDRRAGAGGKTFAAQDDAK